MHNNIERLPVMNRFNDVSIAIIGQAKMKVLAHESTKVSTFFKLIKELINGSRTSIQGSIILVVINPNT